MVKYTAETPQAYLSELDEDWRKERLLAIRAIIQDTVPELSEGIAYGMLGFERDGSVFCHLNAQRAFVGLYLGDVARLDPDGELTSDLNVGKGCIRVRKSDDLDVLRTLIELKADLPDDTGGC
ncbi:MAG: DUF1801 domain-containing protein [Boseongicola sp.]|nr:DUF1801 domain-containing protein [Boseongicola sp.]NNL17618.1 DUF1801 domain-containing protein [Boseongicola sp.]